MIKSDFVQNNKWILIVAVSAVILEIPLGIFVKKNYKKKKNRIRRRLG